MEAFMGSTVRVLNLGKDETSVERCLNCAQEGWARALALTPEGA
jgi:hypothetical protein